MSRTVLIPAQFDATPPYDLLRAAERGQIGFDLRLIRSLTARPNETLEGLGRFTAEVREDRLLDLDEQCLDLYRHFNSPAAIPFYLRRVRENLGDIPDEIVEALAALGDAALEPVLALQDELGPDDRQDLAFLLAAIGVRDPRVHNILRETLARDPYEGALCAGLYCDPSLRPDLESALDTLPADATEDRRALENCLDQLRHPANRAVEPFNLFALYPETADPFLDHLSDRDVLAYLDCDDETYRLAAAATFRDTDYSIPARDALLARARRDPSPAVRAACCRALGSRATEDHVRGLLAGILRDESAPLEVRAGALVGLSDECDLRDFNNFVLDFHEQPATRAAALEAMWRSLDPSFAQYFAQSLRDADPEVRRQAVVAAGMLPLPDLAIELVPLFDDPEVRADALSAYALAAPLRLTSTNGEALVERIEELAGGLDEDELDSLHRVLEARLEAEGPDEPEPEPVPAARSEKVPRNAPCPCGSGKKYKKCCGAVT